MVKRIAIAALLLPLAGCVGEHERSRPLPAPRLAALYPDRAAAGESFNPQPDGSSALAMTGVNLLRGCRVGWNGEPLETAGGDDTRSLAAIVPKRLTERPGVAQITVELADGTRSNALPFTVIGYAPQSHAGPGKH
jgi:hypothetical protein